MVSKEQQKCIILLGAFVMISAYTPLPLNLDAYLVLLRNTSTIVTLFLVGFVCPKSFYKYYPMAQSILILIVYLNFYYFGIYRLCILAGTILHGVQKALAWMALPILFSFIDEKDSLVSIATIYSALGVSLGLSGTMRLLQVTPGLALLQTCISAVVALAFSYSLMLKIDVVDDFSFYGFQESQPQEPKTKRESVLRTFSNPTLLKWMSLDQIATILWWFSFMIGKEYLDFEYRSIVAFSCAIGPLAVILLRVFVKNHIQTVFLSGVAVIVLFGVLNYAFREVVPFLHFSLCVIAAILYGILCLSASRIGVNTANGEFAQVYCLLGIIDTVVSTIRPFVSPLGSLQ